MYSYQYMLGKALFLSSTDGQILLKLSQMLPVNMILATPVGTVSVKVSLQVCHTQDSR